LASFYDVVCPRCGEIHRWCKYDPPIDECENCGNKLAHKEDGELVWNDDVLIFGVWSTNIEVKEASERIKRKFEQIKVE